MKILVSYSVPAMVETGAMAEPTTIFVSTCTNPGQRML